MCVCFGEEEGGGGIGLGVRLGLILRIGLGLGERLLHIEGNKNRAGDRKSDQ